MIIVKLMKEYMTYVQILWSTGVILNYIVIPFILYMVLTNVIKRVFIGEDNGTARSLTKTINIVYCVYQGLVTTIVCGTWAYMVILWMIM